MANYTKEWKAGICSKCKLNKRKENNSWCQGCYLKKYREYYKKDPDAHKKRVLESRKKHPESFKRVRRRYLMKLKIDTLTAYAKGKLECKCCGIKEIEFLTIDHINNDGAKERRESRMKGGSQFYLWLKKLGFPERNYQILCLNCNRAKYDYGICPHNKK